MAQFIDRRLNAKNKSMVNRQRFLRRYKEQIKDSVADAVNRRSITDTETGEDVSGPRLGPGSGSTPTLMGTGGQDRFVVITDGQPLSFSSMVSSVPVHCTRYMSLLVTT